MLFKLIVLAVILECLIAATAAKKGKQSSTAAAKLVTEEEFRAPIDKGYKLQVDVKKNWHNAYEICRKQDLQLATIETKAQQAFIAKLIHDYGFAAEQFWVSGTDLSHESRFSWCSNGSPFKYTNWSPNQPDNFKGNENCMQLWGNQKWNDIACSNEYFFICEEPWVNQCC